MVEPWDVRRPGSRSHSESSAVGGIKSTDNLLHVVSWVPSTGVYNGRDVSDFTLADGTITAGTIDLSAAGTKFSAMWTNAPAS